MNILNRITAILQNSGSYPVYLDTTEFVYPQPLAPYIVVTTDGIYLDESSVTIQGNVTRERVFLTCEFFAETSNECWQMHRDVRNQLFNAGVRVKTTNKELQQIENQRIFVLPTTYEALVGNNDGYPDEDFSEITGSINNLVGRFMVFGPESGTFVSASSELHEVSGAVHVRNDLIVSGSIIGNIQLSGSVPWTEVTGKPAGLVSSSAQVDYTLIQNQPTSIATASFALTASYVSGAAALPSGVVSSSAQTISHLTGTNILSGSVESSSYAVSASWAPSPATASYALTASFALNASAGGSSVEDIWMYGGV
jgi:hypothetical protein